MSEPAGFREIEHPADLALSIWGRTEEEMLTQGAAAVVDRLTEGAPVDDVEERRVELSALDREDRLVRFLNEVIVLAIVEGFLVARAEVRLRDDGLSAVLRGEPRAHGKIAAELKSATYHDLRITDDEGRVSSLVVIDV